MAWQAESERIPLLRIARRNKILILRMFVDETGDEGTEWHNLQMTGAREIECKSGELRPQAMAFQRPRHFGVIKDDTIRKTSIGEQGTTSVNEQFETPGGFVVGDA